MNPLEESVGAWPVNGLPATLAGRTRRVYDRLAAVYPVSTMLFHSRAHRCALVRHSSSSAGYGQLRPCDNTRPPIMVPSA